MITERMLKISRYLNEKRKTNYKEIARALEIKDRAVRYDIDGINDELEWRKLEQIIKEPKGVLIVPEGLDLTVLIDEENFVFSQKERVQILQAATLLDTKNFNIRIFSEQFGVTRRSIQNDLSVVQKYLEKYGMQLEYENGFSLRGESEISFRVRSTQIRKYISSNPKSKTAFASYQRDFFTRIFSPISIDAVIGWVNQTMEQLNWRFSDETYSRYVSDILTFTWYLKNERPLPQKTGEKESEIYNRTASYEEILGRKLSDFEKSILAGFSKYTNRYRNINMQLDLSTTEDVMRLIIEKMDKELNMNFSRDRILIKALINHIAPLLERVKDGLQLDEDTSIIIPEEYQYVYHAMTKVLSTIGGMENLTENERVYLAIFFIGSLKRIQQDRYLNVLLVCGFGYGTTAIVKDQLISEFQVYVREHISAYMLPKYDKWNEIDVVISTVNLEVPVKKPVAQVNVIFKKEDYIKLDLLGLRRRSTLMDYFSIEKKLGFLEEKDRNRVMNIIKDELGHKEISVPKKYYKLSDILEEDSILCIEKVSEWQNAVRYSTRILEGKGYIDESYYQNIIEGIDIQGFYCVTDESFALVHGNQDSGIYVSCMSLVITKEPVIFGDKKTNLIFCLASIDKKEHVPAIIRLMRMVSLTNFIDELKQCSNRKEAMAIIKKCEEEVE